MARSCPVTGSSSKKEGQERIITTSALPIYSLPGRVVPPDRGRKEKSMLRIKVVGK